MTYEITKNAVKTGIIAPEDLAALLNSEQSPKVKLIDATFALPNADESPPENFQKQRISQAQFFDISAIADKTSPLPHMLPGADDFAQSISALGIANDDLVVAYGQSGMIMGPARAWWMFRTFGHNAVCVLDGGLPAWLDAGLPVNTDPPAQASPTLFSAVLKPNMVAGREQVKNALNDPAIQILDARPAARFDGNAPEPRPRMLSGHIPGAKNIPAPDLVDETGRMKPPQELAALLKQAGHDPSKQTITSCGSGITACALALALHQIGEKTAIYDGSWSEWGQEKLGLPIA